MTDYDSVLLDQKRAGTLIIGIHSLVATSDPSHYRLEDIEVRSEMLDGYWAEFIQRDFVLQRVSERLKERSYFKESQFSAVQAKFLEAKARMKERIRTLTAAALSAGTALTSNRAHIGNDADGTPNSNPSLQALEKLRLPHFNGNQRDWETFKEKFSSLIISDPAMASIIKFEHLYNCLDGEAAEKLKGTKVAGENFQTAWDTLCRRYDNKYLRLYLQMETLVKLPASTSESARHLSLLLNAINESVNTFTALKRPVDKWDDFFIFFIESKLPVSTRLDWAREVERKAASTFPKFSDMKTFIEDRVRTLDLVTPVVEHSLLKEHSHGSSQSNSSAFVTKDKKKAFSRRPNSSSVNVATQRSGKSVYRGTCSFCGDSHFIGYCGKFAACTQDQRKAHVVSAKLCFNCLNSNHSAEVCNSQGRCMVCAGKHHTKLHREVSPLNKDGQHSMAAHTLTEEVNGISVSTGNGVLLSTACVILESSTGQRISVRALLDSGAEESFLTEHVAQALSLRRKATNTVVSGVGGEPTVVAKNAVKVILKSEHNTEFKFEFSALVLRKLTALLPRSEIRRQAWPHLEGLQLADPHFGAPARVDCILSSAAYAAAILPGVKKGIAGTPVALHSVFGWVLMGSINQNL